MKPEIPLISGEEMDMLCKSSRRILRSDGGRAKAMKRKYWKRLRKFIRQFITKENDQ